MPVQYDPSRSWDWNRRHPPVAVSAPPEVVPFAGEWNWCGLPVNSPLGVAAGPLLNGAWLAHYARLGFDILVYKTVRTSARACYDLPNLVPVSATQLSATGTIVAATDSMQGSWAVSFGMPSVDVMTWTTDVRQTRSALRSGQVLVVSVVGTQSDTDSASASLALLADDFARCAAMAVDAGADGVEANFSCPNVCTDDGQLYQQPATAGEVAAQIRAAIGAVPLVLKIGFVESRDHARRLVDAVAPSVNGLAMTNAISASVRSSGGELLFDGQSRGICGDAIRDASVHQVAMFADVIERTQAPLHIVGVGGISTLAHVEQYLSAGASSVAMATAPMVTPDVALEIREQRGRS